MLSHLSLVCKLYNVDDLYLGRKHYNVDPPVTGQ